MLCRRRADDDPAGNGQRNVDGLRVGGNGRRTAGGLQSWRNSLAGSATIHRPSLRRGFCGAARVGDVVAADDVRAGSAKRTGVFGATLVMVVAGDVCKNAVGPVREELK